jgi:hypothetical protein
MVRIKMRTHCLVKLKYGPAAGSRGSGMGSEEGRGRGRGLVSSAGNEASLYAVPLCAENEGGG